MNDTSALKLAFVFIFTYSLWTVDFCRLPLSSMVFTIDKFSTTFVMDFAVDNFSKVFVFARKVLILDPKI